MTTSGDDLPRLRADQRRAAGLRLAARGFALSERWELGAEARANALAFAERMVDRHGLAKDGWMAREIARRTAELDADQAEAEALVPGSSSIRTGSGWLAVDLWRIASAVLSSAGPALRYGDGQAAAYLSNAAAART